MFNEKLSYCVNILSKLIKTSIIFTTRVTNIKLELKDDKKLKDLVNKSNMLCVCEDSIVVFKSGLVGIKIKIDYDNIDTLVVDLQNEKLIRINLKNEIKNYSFFIFAIENRNKVIEKLKCHFIIFHTQKYAIFEELKIIHEHNIFKEIKIGKIKIDDKFLSLFAETRKDEFQKKTPHLHITRFYNNYMFYLKTNYELKDANIFYYPELSNGCSARLIIEISPELPIEHLNSNSDILDFSFYSYNKFFNYMLINFKIKDFWITFNSSYCKKMNYGKDPAVWEGWKIECRTKPGKSSEYGLNLVFIFLRRKFIPPFFEMYNDFSFIIIEEYSENKNFHISSNSVEIIEKMADSITPEEYHSPIKDCFKLIEIKLESYLVDEYSLDFFINNISIYGKEFYKLGLTFTLKIVLLLFDFVKERMGIVKEKLLNRIQDAYTNIFFDKTFNLESFEKNIKYTEISKLLIESDLYYDSFFLTKPDLETILTWKDKRNDYLVFCLNGGLTYNLINIRSIVIWLKRQNELRFINPILNQLLNLRVDSFNYDVIEPNINSIVNNMYKIKDFNFNEEMMCIAIEQDYLRIMQEVENKFVYTEFLKFLLEKHFSNKIFTSIYFYIKSLSRNFSNEDKNTFSESASSIKICWSSFLHFFIRIYSNALLCPTILTLACKSLSLLTYFDKFNKTTLISENVVLVITNYLSHQDEKLVFYSAELLSNLLTEARDCIKEILKKNPRLLHKLLKILRGSCIPGCYYSSKTVILISKILIILLNMQNSGIKEILCCEKNRKFVKYLFNYLQNNQYTLPKEMEQTNAINVKIIELLEILVNKNVEFKRYIEENFSFLKLIDSKFKFYLKVIEHTLGATSIINVNIICGLGPNLNLIMSMIKFLKKFISNDIQIIKEIKLNCLNIVKFITLVYEYSKMDRAYSIKTISNESEKLFEILFK